MDGTGFGWDWYWMGLVLDETGIGCVLSILSIVNFKKKSFSVQLKLPCENDLKVKKSKASLIKTKKCIQNFLPDF